MNLDQLQALLGFDFEYFDVIDSTSLYLSRCIKQAKNPPRLVIASEQTNGQGRIGKKFFSPPNTGLYLTFCFAENQIQNSDLTPRLALAVCEAIFDVFSISCGIKWVNDLYLNGRKVCGVLCQKVDSYYLFGIGINMARPESVPSEIKDRFGSLFESCDEKMYPVFVSKLYQSLSNVLNRSKDEILREYRIRLVHLGKPITIFQNNVPISGDMYGITDDFALLVETKNGIESFSSGYMILE